MVLCSSRLFKGLFEAGTQIVQRSVLQRFTVCAVEFGAQRVRRASRAPLVQDAVLVASGLGSIRG